MRPTAKILPLLLAGGLALGACGGGGSSDTATDSTTATADAGGSSSAATVPAGTQVSANDASADEIAAAITAAGVDSADRWAHEVVEYRPYAAGDEARLREELAKYGPTNATIDQILGALTFP